MSDVAELMKRCQRGVGGRNALDEAHDIMAECYGALGRLESERAALEAENARLAGALDRQSVITGDYIARCQRLADELAIARRLIDRIGQLCTTPHESKERFIRRVQSVIEWERAAQQDQPHDHP